MVEAPIYKSRTYECSVHAGHVANNEEENTSLGFEEIVNIITEWADAYDDGLIEYAALAVERSRGQRTHVQGFITFSPEAYQHDDHYRVTKSGNRKFTPSKVIRGSFRLVRSISGAQNYVVRSGIHSGKTGLIHRPLEFGDFVDPAWNTSLRTRTLYEVHIRMKEGFSVEDLRSVFPEKIALIGEHAISVLDKSQRLSASPYESMLAPYCYIGREHLSSEIDIYHKLLT